MRGAAPMQVRLTDPLGQVRYDLYRACDRGVLRIDLPLAANDPAGEWKLTVRELLSDAEGTADLHLQAGHAGRRTGRRDASGRSTSATSPTTTATTSSVSSASTAT